MNRLKIILRTNSTLHEMLLGIVISNIVLFIIGVILSKDRLSAVLGVVIGMMVAMFYAVHMAVTIDDAMCLDEKGAAAQMRKNMLIRYAVVCIVVALVSYFEIANPILLILSCLTIKLGAYLQPAVHRLLNRK